MPAMAPLDSAPLLPPDPFAGLLLLAPSAGLGLRLGLGRGLLLLPAPSAGLGLLLLLLLSARMPTAVSSPSASALKR